MLREEGNPQRPLHILAGYRYSQRSVGDREESASGALAFYWYPVAASTPRAGRTGSARIASLLQLMQWIPRRILARAPVSLRGSDVVEPARRLRRSLMHCSATVCVPHGVIDRRPRSRYAELSLTLARLALDLSPLIVTAAASAPRASRAP